MLSNKELANRLLTTTFVLFLFTIGLDKITQSNLISDWKILEGPVVHFLLPFGDDAIVMIEGIVEIVLGMLLLTRFKAVSLALLVATIALVTTDLFILHYYNLALRELIMIVVCGAMYLLDTSTDELGDRPLFANMRK